MSVGPVQSLIFNSKVSLLTCLDSLSIFATGILKSTIVVLYCTMVPYYNYYCTPTLFYCIIVLYYTVLYYCTVLQPNTGDIYISISIQIQIQIFTTVILDELTILMDYFIQTINFAYTNSTLYFRFPHVLFLMLHFTSFYNLCILTNYCIIVALKSILFSPSYYTYN